MSVAGLSCQEKHKGSRNLWLWGPTAGLLAAAMLRAQGCLLMPHQATGLRGCNRWKQEAHLDALI